MSEMSEQERREKIERIKKIQMIRLLEQQRMDPDAAARAWQNTARQFGDSLSLVGRISDWVGGNTRAAMFGNLVGASPERLSKARSLDADFPSGEEIVAAVNPKAYSEPSLGRSALGLGLEVALDPSTYSPWGALLGVPGKVLKYAARPVGSVVGKIGEKLFKNAFVYADAAARASGKGHNAVSNTAWKNRFDMWSPTTKGVADNYLEIMRDLKESTDGIRLDATKAGALADPVVALKEAKEMAQELVSIPRTRPDGEALLKLIEEYESLGKVDLNRANKIKTKDMQAAEEYYKHPSPGGTFKTPVDASMGSGWKKEIEDRISDKFPSRAEQYKEEMGDLGNLLSGVNANENELRKASTKPLFSQVEGMILGRGITDIEKVPETAGMLALKKLAQYTNYPGGKTTAGLLLNELGTGMRPQSAWAYPMLKRSLIEADREPQSPWGLMNRDQ